MSYILDALRKSDEQRRRGSAPTLLTPQVAQAAPARRHWLLYGLLAVVTLAAGIAIGTLRPWQSSPPSATQETRPPLAAAAPAPAPPAIAGAAPSIVPAPAAKGVPAAAQPASPPATETQAKPAPAPRPAAKAPESARPRKPAPESLVAARDKPAAKASTKKAEPEPPVVAFSELPLPVQQEIPRMAITVHAYSPNPSERLVGMNDQLLREGASVTEHLKIEQITPDGMILTYKGYRFRRGAR